jgi:hypothetical protein
MGTVPRVLVRRTASPAHVFVGLRSLAALVVVRLVVVPLPPSLRADGDELLVGLIFCWTRSVEWKARCGRDVRGPCQVFLAVFSILVLGAFSTGVFNTNALPRINIGADVWGESSIMTGV